MTDRKKSWREIDAGKDKSAHRQEERSPGAKNRAQREAAASASYKKDLDKLFDGAGVPDRFKGLADKLKPEEGSPEALWAEECEKLRAADFRTFVKESTLFVKAGNKLPEDEELLVRFLDHPSESITQRTLAHIVPMLERKSWKRPAPLKNRLTTLSLAAEDPKTIELVKKIEELLG